MTGGQESLPVFYIFYENATNINKKTKNVLIAVG